ncbi:hypothetical protein [Paraburkholderia sp.]|uniref:hypothetical protein n=1 Tax=Paraburkholderia sp. TaxID=1926495 RepID=UPI0025D37D3F|nr:hypothetical protein [Paraburkholderia sp.]
MSVLVAVFCAFFRRYLAALSPDTVLRRGTSPLYFDAALRRRTSTLYFEVSALIMAHGPAMAMREIGDNANFGAATARRNVAARKR